jgi:hypothetical protein
MDRDRTVKFDGECDLNTKTLELGFDVRILDPTVKACLTNDGTWVVGELPAEHSVPFGGPFFDIPRMQSECGTNPGMITGECGDLRPVLGAGTVYDHLREAGLRHHGYDLLTPGIEALVLEVIVGVEEHGGNNETSMTNN